MHLAEVVAQLKTDLANLQEQKTNLDETVSKLQELLGVVAESAAPKVRKKRSPNGTTAASGERKNELSIKEHTANVLKSAKEPLSKGDIAIAVLKAGYQTKSTDDAFIQNVYVVGISKLVEDGHVVSVGERPNTKYKWKGKK
jgi:hypothetical protein